MNEVHMNCLNFPFEETLAAQFQFTFEWTINICDLSSSASTSSSSSFHSLLLLLLLLFTLSFFETNNSIS